MSSTCHQTDHQTGPLRIFFASTPFNLFSSCLIQRQLLQQQGRTQQGQQESLLIYFDQSNSHQAQTLINKLKQWQDFPFDHTWVLSKPQGWKRLWQQRQLFKQLGGLQPNLQLNLQPVEIFLANDRRLEVQFMVSQYPNCDFSYYDDGLYSYYETAFTTHALDQLTVGLKRLIYPWYKNIDDIGTSGFIRQCFVYLPEKLKNSLRTKRIEPIQLSCKKQLHQLSQHMVGIQQTFSSVIFLPKLQNIEPHQPSFQQFVTFVQSHLDPSKSVAIKLHPKDAQKDVQNTHSQKLKFLEFLEKTIWLDPALAIEFFLPSLSPKTQFIGVDSTAALTARLLLPTSPISVFLNETLQPRLSPICASLNIQVNVVAEE